MCRCRIDALGGGQQPRGQGGGEGPGAGGPAGPGGGELEGAVVVAVAEGQTICGVVAGEITCTSIKKGTAAKVAAGESIAWVSGSFGAGVTKGIFQTGDLMVDRGLEAARADWRPVAEPPPAPQ